MVQKRANNQDNQGALRYRARACYCSRVGLIVELELNRGHDYVPKYYLRGFSPNFGPTIFGTNVRGLGFAGSRTSRIEGWFITSRSSP